MVWSRFWKCQFIGDSRRYFYGGALTQAASSEKASPNIIVQEEEGDFPRKNGVIEPDSNRELATFTNAEISTARRKTPIEANDISLAEALPDLPPFLVSPFPINEKREDVYMITVVLRSSGDKPRDILKATTHPWHDFVLPGQ